MEFKNNLPIYLQVIEDIKNRIIQGEVALGEKLPSTRELALQYKVNPNTAVRVYNEMETEGYVFTKRGLGTFVTEDPDKFVAVKEQRITSLVNDFMQGMLGLGISKNEILEYIKKYEVSEEDNNVNL